MDSDEEDDFLEFFCIVNEVMVFFMILSLSDFLF